MTPEELKNLRVGDRVELSITGQQYVIISVEGSRAVAVYPVEVVQPELWKLISKKRKR